MAKGRRSPFGDLVYTHRTNRNLTQRELAARTRVPDPNRDRATVSARAILVIERSVPPGHPWVRSRAATVRALADALELIPGSPEYEAFVRASQATSNGISAREPTPGATVTTTTDASAAGFPFIAAGRVAHLERLRQAVTGAVSGLPGMVFVEAGPGVGKTTLLTQVCREAVRALSGLVALWGACLDGTTTADPRQPVRQVLETLAGSLDDGSHFSPTNTERITDRVPVALEALTNDGDALVDRLLPSGILRARLASGRVPAPLARRLATLLDVLPDPASHGLSPHEAVFRVLQHYASAGPVIVAIDDLHWADGETASFLFHIARRMQGQILPLLVIGTFRPPAFAGGDPAERRPFPPVLHELLRTFPGARVDLSTAVGGESGTAFVDALLATTLGEVPAKLRESLVTQTAGLPLFVRGMLRWYETNGRLRRGQDGRLEFLPTSDPADLPAEIDALFASLVGRLPALLCDVLDVASVQGTAFSADLVMESLGLSPAELIERVDRQLVHGAALLVPGGYRDVAGKRSHTYQFTHSLLRDYVYHQLPEERRAEYHLATAGAILTRYGDGEHEATATMARHFELGGDRRRAATSYIQAGLYAMGKRDYDLARVQFTRVGSLGLADDDAFPVAQSLVGLGNCAYGEGDNLLAVRFFSNAHVLARRANLPVIEATSLASMGRLDLDAGRLDLGARRIGEAINLFMADGETIEACRSLALLSHTRYGQGRYDEAATAARQAIDLAITLGADQLRTGAMIALANCWLDLGLYDEATTLYRDGIAISEELGDTHRAAICWYNLSLCAIDREAWDMAEAALEPLLDPDRRVTARLIAAARCSAGMIAEGQLRFDEARSHYQRSVDLRTGNGQEALAIDSLAGLLRVATVTGDPDATPALLAEIQARVESRGIDGVEHPGRLFLALSAASMALDDPAAARRYVESGLAFIAARAALLADPAHRDSSLGRVPSHRRLAELAGSLGVVANALHTPDD